MIEQRDEQGKSTWKVLVRILTSALFGGLFYSIWLAAFLILSPDEGLIETFLWIISPFVTALGFAFGLSIASHFTAGPATPFKKTFAWPLTGCIIGAVAVYWFGPMLIVFSMLTLGTVSVAVREVVSGR